MNDKFDLDIDNYSINQLQQLFKLPKHFKEEHLKKSELILEKMHPDNSGMPEIYIFFKKAHQIIKDKFYEDPKNKTSNIVRNEYLGSSLKHPLSHVYAYDPNRLDGREISTTTTNHEVILDKVIHNKLNPIKRKSKFINMHFNSKYRDNYYNSSATNYHYTFPQPLEHILSIRLNSICIPNTWYIFSHERGNNRFIIEISGDVPFMKKCNKDGYNVFEIVIEDGNYDANSLEYYLNQKYFRDAIFDTPLKMIEFKIDPNSLKTVFKFKEVLKDKNAHMNIKFVDDQTENVMYTAGWTLGFRYGQYKKIKEYLMSEGLFDAGGDRYVYFCLDDYNKNVSRANIVQFQDSDMREDVLAKVYLLDGKFAINVDNSLENENTHGKIREFFGPVNIKKISIKLLDEYGRLINLNNMDFSYTLEVEQEYYKN